MQPILTNSLRRAERLFGRKEGVVCGEVRLTYAEFGSRCRRLASGLRRMGVGLRRMGVGKGDRVAVLMGNSHRYLEAYSAIPGIGAAIVPLNTRHSIQEHRAILEDCGARVLIADEAHRHVAEEVAPDVEEVLLAPEGGQGRYVRVPGASRGLL